jgi:integrase
MGIREIGRKQRGGGLSPDEPFRRSLFAPMLLSLLGMRSAEVCGLRWSDVDLDAESCGSRTPGRSSTAR